MAEEFSRAVKIAIENDMLRLTYLTSQSSSLRSKMHTDAALVSNDDLLSQLVYIILLAAEDGKSHILYLSSKASKQIVQLITGGNV